MTMDERNQIDITEATHTLSEYQEALTQLQAQIDRINLLMSMAEKQPKMEPVKKKKKMDKTVTTCFHKWIFDRFESEFMPLLKEKTFSNRTKFDPSTALRYLVYYAVRYPQDIKGVELSDLEKYFNVE